MKLFKNFKTKRKLREENERLKWSLMRPEINYIHKDVKNIHSQILVPYEDRDMPIEYIKETIAMNMMREIEPFIIYDFFDDGNGGKIYQGNITVAIGDRFGD